MPLIPWAAWANLPRLQSAFLYLASDEASWVTGTALVIDGGLTAGLPPG